MSSTQFLLEQNQDLREQRAGLTEELERVRKDLFEQGERNDLTRSEVLRVAAERDRARAWAKRWKGKTKGYRKCLDSQESYLQSVEEDLKRYRHLYGCCFKQVREMMPEDAFALFVELLDKEREALDGKEGGK